MKISTTKYSTKIISQTVCMILLIAFSFNANAQKENTTNSNTNKGLSEKAGVAFDFDTEAEAEINVLKTFLHANTDAFSITIYDFKNEKVQVFIYDESSNQKLYSINVEPTQDIFNVNLLTKPLPKGKYYVVVKGESREIPKKMVIE